MTNGEIYEPPYCFEQRLTKSNEKPKKLDNSSKLRDCEPKLQYIFNTGRIVSTRSDLLRFGSLDDWSLINLEFIFLASQLVLAFGKRRTVRQFAVPRLLIQQIQRCKPSGGLTIRARINSQPPSPPLQQHDDTNIAIDSRCIDRANYSRLIYPRTEPERRNGWHGDRRKSRGYISCGGARAVVNLYHVSCFRYSGEKRKRGTDFGWEGRFSNISNGMLGRLIFFLSLTDLLLFIFF